MLQGWRGRQRIQASRGSDSLAVCYCTELCGVLLLEQLSPLTGILHGWTHMLEDTKAQPLSQVEAGWQVAGSLPLAPWCGISASLGCADEDWSYLSSHSQFLVELNLSLVPGAPSILSPPFPSSLSFLLFSTPLPAPLSPFPPFPSPLSLSFCSIPLHFILLPGSFHMIVVCGCQQLQVSILKPPEREVLPAKDFDRDSGPGLRGHESGQLSLPEPIIMAKVKGCAE